MDNDARFAFITTAAVAAISIVLVVLLSAGVVRPIGGAETASIAGIRVPPVSCQEDEVISWVDVDQLGCVHIEDVGE